MPDFTQANEEGQPVLSQVSTDGTHALVYVNNPAFTMMTHSPIFLHATVSTGPTGTPCLRFDLTQPGGTDEALEATRIALEEYNASN